MMLVKLFCSPKSRLIGQAWINRPNLSIRWMQAAVSNSTVDSSEKFEPSSEKVFNRNQARVIKLGKNYHRPYDNYAPILFEWTQQLINNDIRLETLVKSAKFKQVSNAICDTTRHSNKNILNLLKSLLVMRVDPNEPVVRFLEDELIFKLDTYDFKLLVQTFNLYHHLSKTCERREEIVSTIKKNISDKLDSTKPDIKNLFTLVQISQHLPVETLIKIEDQLTKILDQQEDIPLDILCYLLVLLSRHNRRNKPLIRTTVNKLLKYRQEEIYSVPPHLIHMICSLNRLNYPEVNLLEKCSDILVTAKFLENINESAARDFLVAISQLNFSYPKLFDYYLQNLVERPETFKHQDLVTITITLARLHYHNKEMVEVIRSQVLPRCCDPDLFLSKSQWFNFINALTLLECATNEQLRTILNQNFLREMEHEEIENHLARIKQKEIKLLERLRLNGQEVEEGSEEELPSETSEESLSIQNIYHVMNLRRKYLTLCGLVLTQSHQAESKYKLDQILPSPKELHEFESFINQLDFSPLRKSKDLEQFRQAIFKSLDSFAPIDKYMKTNVTTPFGFTIDAIITVDLEGNPVPLKEEDKQNKLTATAKPSEESVGSNRKVALMCTGFNDTLLDSSSTLIGPKEAEVRCLRTWGYNVVCIHQNSMPNYNASGNLNRVKFLQNLIISNLKA